MTILREVALSRLRNHFREILLREPVLSVRIRLRMRVKSAILRVKEGIQVAARGLKMKVVLQVKVDISVKVDLPVIADLLVIVDGQVLADHRVIADLQANMALNLMSMYNSKLTI